jgi:hypothetical protein
VERTIAELGGIFGQLATMVAEQGELAIRIDEHMDETVANVESAQAHLLKYLQRISSNRWLVMKVFAVLLIFMVRCSDVRLLSHDSEGASWCAGLFRRVHRLMCMRCCAAGLVLRAAEYGLRVSRALSYSAARETERRDALAALLSSFC